MIADAGDLIALHCDEASVEYALATVRCVSVGVPVEAQVPIDYQLTLDGPQVPLLKSLFETGAKISIVFAGTHYVALEGEESTHTVGCRYFGIQLSSTLIDDIAKAFRGR